MLKTLMKADGNNSFKVVKVEVGSMHSLQMQKEVFGPQSKWGSSPL